MYDIIMAASPFPGIGPCSGADEIINWERRLLGDEADPPVRGNNLVAGFLERRVVLYMRKRQVSRQRLVSIRLGANMRDYGASFSRL
jgi:hypothetical protein